MRDRWAASALALIAVLAGWHLVVGVLVDLGDAEALYFCYGLHLQGGYLDHPPMIGWFIAAVTWLLGDSPGAVRVVPTVCHAATLAGIYVLGVESMGSRRAGFLAVVALSLVPMVTIGGIAAAPDAPASALWVWTAVVIGRVLRRVRRDGDLPKWWEASLIGGLVGLTFLAKYTGFLLIPSALMALSHTDHKRILRSRSILISAASCAAMTLPVVLWNIDNQWVSIVHRLVWTQGSGVAIPSLTTLGSTFGGQLLYLGPLMALALGWAFVALVRHRDQAEHHLLLSLAAPTLAFTYLLCLCSPAAEPHWPAQGYLTLAVGLGGMLSSRSGWSTWLKVAAVSAVSLLLVILVALHVLIFTTAWPDLVGPKLYEPRYDLSNELLGWPEVAREAMNVRRAHEPLAGSHYIICSQIEFAVARTCGRGTARVLCLSEEVDDFDLWGEGSTDGIDSILYIEDDRFGAPSDDIFSSREWELEEVDSVSITRGRWVVRSFALVRATRVE